ncbi:MAG: capsid protein [Wigfec virus K19_525]|nr:MAG: capsid protein [Wigfec virus K19_525]
MFYKKRRGVAKPKKTIYKRRRGILLKKMPVVSVNAVKTMVKKEIAGNIENKFTTTKVYSAPVGNVFNSGIPNVYSYTFYVWCPSQQTNATTQQLFNIPLGPNQNNRIGNSIKIKRWVIKGMISPNIFGTLAPYTALGYVDVYFGRLKLNTKDVTDQLPDLYQNGGSSITPTMKNTDILLPLNKDVYKVYYHRRFKTGTSGIQGANTSLPLASEPVNNDYKLTHTFGFDVCKYICKDRKITFSDMNNTPLDIDLASLTLWATFTPFTGQAFNNTTPAGQSLPTYMNLSATTYAEYEDA